VENAMLRLRIYQVKAPPVMAARDKKLKTD